MIALFLLQQNSWSAKYGCELGRLGLLALRLYDFSVFSVGQSL